MIMMIIIYNYFIIIIIIIIITAGGASSRRYSLIDPHKIIIRLRVDHEGYPSVNQQRFGAQFIG